MIETCTKPTEQRNANLMALHRQLQEMAAVRNASSRESKQSDRVQGPVLVIRGK